MNERLEQKIELWKHKRCSYDERGDISATAQHFYNLALEDVKKDVEKTIGALKKQNPNPLGTITECLADSEITALETVVDFINNQKSK